MPYVLNPFTGRLDYYVSGGSGGGDVVGPASSTDNALVRFDGLTGKLIKNSVGILDNAGVLTGLTQLNVDNLRLDGNTLSSTDTNGDVNIVPDGSGNINLDSVEWPNSGVTTGDLLYASASNTLSKLAIGTGPGRPLITDGTNPLWFTPFQYVYEYDDFICSAQTASISKLSWGRVAQNGGSTAFNTADSDAAHPGLVSIETGTSTNGAGGIFLGTTPLLFGGGLIRINMLIKLSALSDGTDTYTFRAGFGDNTTGGAQVDGAYFEYTHGTNSGNYQILTASNSSRTTANTSTAASTNWDLLTIECNAAGTSVAFFINGSQVANSPIAATIPTGAGRGFGVVLSMTKSAGTASRACLFDLFEMYQKLTVSR